MLPRLRRTRKPQGDPDPEPPSDDLPNQDGHELRMSFMAHLEELRVRLFRSFLALIVGTTIGAFLAEPVIGYLLEPYRAINPDEARRLLVLGPTGSVIAYFRVALMLGGIITIPYITYQVMAFIIPGLKRKERRFVISSLPAITLLFLAGIVFAWTILMPPAIAFLEGFQSENFQAEWAAGQYITFVTALLFWMGVAFEMPLVLFVLSLIGVVGPKMLIKNWRMAVVLSAIAAAFITPTVDPVNMMLVMGPLVGLYLVSIVLVALGVRIRTPRASPAAAPTH